MIVKIDQYLFYFGLGYPILAEDLWEYLVAGLQKDSLRIIFVKYKTVFEKYKVHYFFAHELGYWLVVHASLIGLGLFELLEMLAGGLKTIFTHPKKLFNLTTCLIPENKQ